MHHPVPETLRRQATSSLEDTLLLLDILVEAQAKDQQAKKVPRVV